MDPFIRVVSGIAASLLLMYALLALTVKRSPMGRQLLELQELSEAGRGFMLSLVFTTCGVLVEAILIPLLASTPEISRDMLWLGNGLILVGIVLFVRTYFVIRHRTQRG